jgi:hypothetical protein
MAKRPIRPLLFSHQLRPIRIELMRASVGSADVYGYSSPIRSQLIGDGDRVRFRFKFKSHSDWPIWHNNVLLPISWNTTGGSRADKQKPRRAGAESFNGGLLLATKSCWGVRVV